MEYEMLSRIIHSFLEASKIIMDDYYNGNHVNLWFIQSWSILTSVFLQLLKF